MPLVYPTTDCRKSGLERDDITVWDFGDLSTQVTLKLDDMTVQGFPTLIDQETHVALRVLDNPITAQTQFHSGIRRLFLLALPTKKLIKQMPIDTKLCLQYMKVGDCEQLKRDMLTAIVDSIFLVTPLPRKKADFEERLLKGKQRLMQVAHEYATQLAKVLEEYNTLTQQLQKTL